MKPDPEWSPLKRLIFNAAIIAALLALSLVGPDVDEHNLRELREFVSGK